MATELEQYVGSAGNSMKLTPADLKADKAKWEGLLAANVPGFEKQWEACAPNYLGCSLGHPIGIEAARWRRMNDSWADGMANSWALNSDYGFAAKNFWNTFC